MGCFIGGGIVLALIAAAIGMVAFILVELGIEGDAVTILSLVGGIALTLYWFFHDDKKTK